MPSDQEINDPDLRPGGILVISRRGVESDKCAEILESHAHRGWNQPGDPVRHLRVNGARFGDDLLLMRDIDQFAASFPTFEFEVLLCRSSPISSAILRQAEQKWSVVYTELRIPHFEKRLGRVLRNFQLNWFSAVCHELSSYDLGGPTEITERSVERWLDQFRELEAGTDLRWLGKGLLRSLQYRTLRSLTNVVMPQNNELKDFDYICLYSNVEAPKGGDMMKFLLSKELLHAIPEASRPKCCTLREALNRPDPCNVLWVEDGLHTATEIRSLIRSLLGRSEPGRKPKVEPLDNPEWFKNKRIQFRFGTASNLGCRILNAFLKENGLAENCELFNEEATSMRTLTPAGCEAFEDGTLWVGGGHVDDPNPLHGPYLADPKEHLNLHAFRDEAIWGGRKREAVSICRRIGKQLFRRFLDRKEKNSGWTMWDARCINECGLGMMGLGYALAFSHSVPKCSLPLLWVAGDVTMEYQSGAVREVSWEPLFPGVV